MRYQPQGLQKLDRGNKFAKSAAFVSCAGSASEVVSGKLPSFQLIGRSISKIGLGWACTGSGKQVEYDLAPLITSDGSGGGDFTLFAFSDAPPTDSVGALFSQKNDSLGSPYTQVSLYANGDVNGATQAGTLTLLCYSGGGFNQTAISALDGKPHFFVVTRLNGAFYFYRDGVALSSTFAGSVPANTGVLRAGQKTGIGATGNSGTEAYSRVIQLSGALNMGLTAAQAAEFSSNPWQLFQAPDEEDFVAAGGAAALAGVASGAAAGTGSLTTTVNLAGAASTAASSTAALATAIRLSGAAFVGAAGAANLSSAISLAGAGQSAATASGALATAVKLAGSAVVSASATAAMVAQGSGLSGAAVAAASAAGALTNSICLSGSAAGTATAAGTLTAAGAGLAGSASAASSATGAVTAGIRLAGGAVANVSATGSFASAGAVLAGAATASSSASGAITTGISLQSASGAAVFAAGQLTTAIRLAGQAQATISGSAALQSGVIYARAPAGAGFTPQRQNESARPAQVIASRPANTQGSTR